MTTLSVNIFFYNLNFFIYNNLQLDQKLSSCQALTEKRFYTHNDEEKDNYQANLWLSVRVELFNHMLLDFV